MPNRRSSDVASQIHLRRLVITPVSPKFTMRQSRNHTLRAKTGL